MLGCVPREVPVIIDVNPVAQHGKYILLQVAWLVYSVVLSPETFVVFQHARVLRMAAQVL